MSTTTSHPVAGSPWRTWPDTERVLQEWIDDSLAALPEARAYVDRLERVTSTRVFDWTDHLRLAGDREARQTLHDLGFRQERVAVPRGSTSWHHPGAQFPRLVLHSADGPLEPTGLALKCDRVADALLAAGSSRPIRGAARSAYREATLFENERAALHVVERCGDRGHVPVAFGGEDLARCEQAQELWRNRGRWFDDDAVGMRAAQQAAEGMVEMVGADAAAWLAFEVERDYWQRHNRAGQVQKNRQDRIGLGWANHDHHTFRSSRVHFAALMHIFHTFGFVDRERFYAGREAGWGAQILEQPTCGLVVFADVDLMPEEMDVDFANEPLEPWDQLGTVGLWCALHGESMLSAGMHHLEAQFEFDDLRDALEQQGVGMMKPFSDMDHLRQAFTEGERWPVRESRLAPLLERGLIDADQAARFRQEGAVGSHLENLQRRGGFKGFNSKNVSDIIARTDPRRVGG